MPITNHLRDHAPSLKKYKTLHFFRVSEDRNQEDHKQFGIFIPYIENIMNS